MFPFHTRVSNHLTIISDVNDKHGGPNVPCDCCPFKIRPAIIRRLHFSFSSSPGARKTDAAGTAAKELTQSNRTVNLQFLRQALTNTKVIFSWLVTISTPGFAVYTLFPTLINGNGF